jgi:hypothetical protein
MINKYDAQEIAKLTADGFRTRVSHQRVDLTTNDYDHIYALCIDILDEYVDNAGILDRQLDPKSGVIIDGSV